MEKTERWFLKRDVKNPERLVYASTKGEVSWDVPVDSLPTVEEKQHWDRHPKFVSLQRARDGWAWYTSNIGRLLPNYRDIDVDGEEESLPYLGNSDFHAWQQIPGGNLAPLESEEAPEVPFLPSQLRFEQAESHLPSAPTGSTGGASRRIQGEIRLPPLPPPTDPLPTQVEEALTGQRHEEDDAPSMETQGPIFPSRGGGVLPPTPPLPEEDPEEDQEDPEEDRHLGDDIRELFDEFNRDSVEEGDISRTDDYPQRENSRENSSGQNGQNGGATSSRPSRQLRNRNVARSVKDSKSVKFHEVVGCVEQDHYYQESVHFDKEGTLFPPFQSRDDVELLSRERWELLYDPTPSRALKRTRQQASIVAQQMLAKPQVSSVCLLDQKMEATGYTVLSDVITKKMDRD